MSVQTEQTAAGFLLIRPATHIAGRVTHPEAKKFIIRLNAPEYLSSRQLLMDTGRYPPDDMRSNH